MMTDDAAQSVNIVVYVRLGQDYPDAKMSAFGHWPRILMLKFRAILTAL